MRGLLGGDYDHTLISLLSAPIFFTLFIGLIWLLYQRGQKAKYDSYSLIPLEHDSSDNNNVSNQDGNHG